MYSALGSLIPPPPTVPIEQSHVQPYHERGQERRDDHHLHGDVQQQGRQTDHHVVSRSEFNHVNLSLNLFILSRNISIEVFGTGTCTFFLVLMFLFMSRMLNFFFISSELTVYICLELWYNISIKKENI